MVMLKCVDDIYAQTHECLKRLVLALVTSEIKVV